MTAAPTSSKPRLRVFEEKGLEGANMRSIAREAGYTPGALYFYYASQEEIYADLLSHSLRRLHAATCEAGAEYRRRGTTRARSSSPARWRFTITTRRGPMN